METAQLPRGERSTVEVMQEYHKGMPYFCEHYHIGMTCQSADHNPHKNPYRHLEAAGEWSHTASHWRVTFHYQGRQMITYFSQGSAHTLPPTAADVLDCLCSDAASVDQTRGFEDFASDLGYDPDSRKAEKLYRTCRRQAARLKILLGDLYEMALYEVERM